MKSILPFFVICLIFTAACKQQDKQSKAQIIKILKQKELVFTTINKNWNFTPRTLTPESQTIANNWDQWRLFVAELYQKPKGTIGAFKRKTQILVNNADALPNTIPEKLNKPQIKIRLNALITKIKALQAFLNLDKIPEKRTINLLLDLSIEVNAFQDQIEEIVRRNQIPVEEGEQEMLNQVKPKNAPTTPTHITPTPNESIQEFQEIK